MLFDEALISYYHYAPWLVLACAGFKLIHLLLYKGAHPALFSLFFIIFPSYQIEQVRQHRDRYYFRKVHNLLTTTFYILAGVWVCIYLIVGNKIT